MSTGFCRILGTSRHPCSHRKLFRALCCGVFALLQSLRRKTPSANASTAFGGLTRWEASASVHGARYPFRGRIVSDRFRKSTTPSYVFCDGLHIVFVASAPLSLLLLVLMLLLLGLSLGAVAGAGAGAAVAVDCGCCCGCGCCCCCG